MTIAEAKASLEDLSQRLESAETEAQKLRDKIKGLQHDQESIELDPDDYTDQYDQMLDECNPIEINGYIEILYSDALRDQDPIAYRCGLSDFMDTIDLTESQEYKDLEEEIEDLEYELCELDDLLVDLQDQYDDLESELSLVNSIKTQFTEIIKKYSSPLFEIELNTGDYLIANLSINDRGIVFEFDQMDLNVWFDGEITELEHGIYLLPFDPYFGDINHYLDLIYQNIIDGFLIPNSLFKVER